MLPSVSKADFKTEVLDSPIPVIVDFWAAWCNPCRALAPVLEQLAQEAGGAFKIVKVDTDANADLAAEYNVSALPTLKVFKAGEVINTGVGLMTKDRVKQLLVS
jgi:thioredoxin 1